MTSPWPAPVLASAAVFLAVAASAARVEDDLLGHGSGARTGAVGGSRIVGRIGRVPMLRRMAGVEHIATLLAAAGWDRSPEEVAGAKWLGASIAAGLALVIPGSAVFAPVFGVAAFRAPDILLVRSAKRRRIRADRELPLFLDLLAAGATAGLTGQLAARRATEATEGPLAEELSAALHRVDLGGRWRDELADAAERLDLPDLRRTTAVLARSESIGSSLAETLWELARESRETRRALVAERARKAPVKMLFPLVFLVLPAFLLLTVVPVLVTTLQSIR